MVGLGVLRPGQMALLTGSSHLHLGMSESAFHRRGVWGTYEDAVVPGVFVVEGGQTSTGSVVSWFKRTFAPETPYATLDQEAAEAGPGSSGLLCLEHWQGNRTPHTDALSRGTLTGE